MDEKKKEIDLDEDLPQGENPPVVLGLMAQAQNVSIEQDRIASGAPDGNAALPDSKTVKPGHLNDRDEQARAWGLQDGVAGSKADKAELMLGMPWRLWEVLDKPSGERMVLFTTDADRAKRTARTAWNTTGPRGSKRPVNFEIRSIGEDEVYIVEIEGVTVTLTGKQWVAVRLMNLKTAHLNPALTVGTDSEELAEVLKRR